MIISKFNILDTVYGCTLSVHMRLAANIGCKGIMVRLWVGFRVVFRVRVRVRNRVYFGCDVSNICVHVELYQLHTVMGQFLSTSSFNIKYVDKSGLNNFG